MPDRFVESHIKQIPMFQNLAPQHIDLIVKAFQVLQFEPGEIVVKQGNPTQGLFVIISGQGVLTRTRPDGSETRVGTLGENDVLDRGALFETGTETASLRITKPAVVLFLSRKRMQTVLSYYPEVRERLGTSDVGTSAPPPRTVDSRNLRTKQSIQRENEDVILVRHRHPWAFVRRGWMALLLLLLFTGGAAAIFMTDLPFLFGVLVLLTGLVLAALLMLYFYLEWRNDSIMVTNTRVVRVERVIPSFSVYINEIPLSRIQEVNTELPEGDLFARIFRYGDIELKNASDAGDMVLDTIPDPEEVQQAIFENQAARQEEAEDNKRNAIRAEIKRTLETDHQPKTSTGAAGDAIAAAGSIPDDTDEPSTKPRYRGWSPARMKFVNTDGDTVYRKHVTIWLAHIFGPTLLMVLSGIALTVSVVSFNTLGAAAPMIMIGSMVLLVIGVLWFWWSDWDWRNDLYILGDDRVTLIHRRPLWLQNEVEQVLVNRVDNVVSETSGFLDTIFQRGNVRLSLVGEGIENAKVFTHVYRPHEIQAEISRRQERAKVQQEQAEERRQREAIKEYLSVYHEMQGSQGAEENPSEVSPYHAQDRQRPPNVPRSREE